jgi:hypothetical protein
MKLTATMMLSVDGVHQAPEAATSPRLVDSRRVEASRDGHSDGEHGLLPTDIFSTSVQLGARGDVSRDCEGSGTYVLHWLRQLCLAPGPAPCADSSAFRETVARRAERGGQLLVHSMRGGRYAVPPRTSICRNAVGSRRVVHESLADRPQRRYIVVNRPDAKASPAASSASTVKT